MRGKKSTPHRDKHDPPRRRANKRKGIGTFERDRPPIMSIISRSTGECRYWVLDRTKQEICRQLIDESIPEQASVWFYTDSSSAYWNSYPRHAS